MILFGEVIFMFEGDVYRTFLERVGEKLSYEVTRKGGKDRKWYVEEELEEGVDIGMDELMGRVRELIREG